MRALEVLDPGPFATVQDLGRPGLAHLGVTGSGALDPTALRLANRLVGNPESAAGIELMLGGLVVRPMATVVVAVTGAPCQVGMNAPLVVRAGETLSLGLPSTGLRTYVAVRGGVDVAPVLGSRSTDTLSGLGPPPLSAGDLLPIGAEIAGDPLADFAPQRPLRKEPVLRILPGPRDDWFDADALPRLCAAPYVVSPDSDRIGVRLLGAELTRVVTHELPSEPMVLGALQVPPSGRPILFVNDHPVTGGYPVIAVVRAADLRLATQLRPGERLRFSLR